MSQNPAFSNDLLELIFHGTAIAGIADNAAAPVTELFLSLHVGSPIAFAQEEETSPAVQTDDEVAYTGYARQAVTRDATGWSVVGTSVLPIDEVEFPVVADVVTPYTAGFFGIGTLVSGAGQLLYYGQLNPPLSITNGLTPRIDPHTGEAALASGWSV